MPPTPSGAFGIGTCVVAAAGSTMIVYDVATGAEEPELWVLALAAAMSLVIVATFLDALRNRLTAEGAALIAVDWFGRRDTCLRSSVRKLMAHGDPKTSCGRIDVLGNDDRLPLTFKAPGCAFTSLRSSDVTRFSTDTAFPLEWKATT